MDVVAGSIGGMPRMEELQSELEVLRRRVEQLEASIAQARSRPVTQLTEDEIYLTRMVKKLDDVKDFGDVDMARAEEASKQAAVLRVLKSVMTARLQPDQSAADRQKAVLFSASMDDDEVLLSLFNELDTNGNLTISKEELCGSRLFKNDQNQEIKRVLLRALECGFAAVMEALEHLEATDFGVFACMKHSQTFCEPVFDRETSVKNVYDAALQGTIVTSATGTISGVDTGVISKADLEKFIEEFPTRFGTGSWGLVTALKKLASSLPDEGELNFMALKAAARKVPRVVGHRMAWVGGLGLDAALARHLPPGTLEDGLEGLKKHMNIVAAEKALDAYCMDVRNIFIAAVTKAQEDTGSKSAIEANSKFEGFEGSFACLSDFHAGAEVTMKLGYPNPDIERGILLEHTAHPSVTRLFATSNYQIATCLLIEYALAIDPFAPQDTRVQDILKRLHTERMDDNEHAKDCGMQNFFPGEVGDSFRETLVFIKFERILPGLADSKRLIDRMLSEANGGDVLKTDEEHARGATTLDHAACLKWMAKNSSVLQATPSLPGGGDQTLITVSNYSLVGVVLPMPKTRAAARCKVLREATSKAYPAASVQVSVEACKTWTFCDHTGIEGLRKFLGEFKVAELKQIAKEDWGVSTAEGLSRESISSLIATRFVCKELQVDLRAALENILDKQLKDVLLSWGATPASSRTERIEQATQALNSEERWKQVAEWVGLYRGRMQGRKKIGLKQMMKQKAGIIEQYKLKQGEVLALFLYTGAEFLPINALCRNSPEKILSTLQGEGRIPRNTLTTMLFCIISGLKKLGLHTRLPEDRKVFRGLGNMLLPSQFWVPHGTPSWKGGVERAFMSATADKDVALRYANGRGTLVEISVGRIQMGGDISFLSMYPGEKEITFPPYTCLEANGDPRVERTLGGEVVIFPLQVCRHQCSP